ncbi:MAG: endonuclease/exonuclease/phosphatase family protein [Bacteroidales bacterium]|nr:endonuclease/exonuclease/phosphatase family protein [Bacteroidales bacterium]
MVNKEEKKRSWLSSLSFGSISMVLSVLLLLAYVSVVADPAKAWFFTLFGLLYPLVLPVTLVLFVWSLFRRSRARLLLAIALLPSLFFAGRYIQFSGPKDPPEATLKVVSYNVGLFAHGPKDMERMDLADSIAAYVRSLDADIICLQEVWIPSGFSMEGWLRNRFPGYWVNYYGLNWGSGRAGNVTLSRRPVVDKGKHDFEHSTNLALWADVRLGRQNLRIYNCHLESYNISLSNLVKQRSSVEETERKMRRSIAERPKQVAEVLRGLEASPVPSLVAGDFNDNPVSYTYFRLLRGRRDSFVRAGKGFGATYRILWPLLRIDYLLYPPALSAVSYTVDRVKWSDHYPVIATYHESGRDSQ